MNTPTFKEQFDKVTRAYMQDRLRPYTPCACFIGNILNNKGDWCMGRSSMGDLFPFYYNGNLEAAKCIKMESNGFYSPEDIVGMEENFLQYLHTIPMGKYEDLLYMAMDSTLDMLRKIHESKGEVIESFEFKKRELVKT